jgi:hypothetical protein
MIPNVCLRTIAAPPKTTTAKTTVSTPEYTARRRGFERILIVAPFLSEEVSGMPDQVCHSIKLASERIEAG